MKEGVRVSEKFEFKLKKYFKIHYKISLALIRISKWINANWKNIACFKIENHTATVIYYATYFHSNNATYTIVH